MELKNLESLKALSQKVEIIIPDEKGNVFQYQEEYRDYFLTVFSKMFGGATSVQADGGYMAKNGKLIMEKVYKVYSYTDEITPENLSKILEYAEWLKMEMNQECIGLEVNGNFYLV